MPCAEKQKPPLKASPFGRGGIAQAMTERASPSPESRHAAISWLFGRAMLSLRLLFFVSILALSGAPRQLSQGESQDLSELLHSRTKNSISRKFACLLPQKCYNCINRTSIFFQHPKEVFVCRLIVNLPCVFWVAPSIRGGYQFAPSGLSAGSSVYPDCHNAHLPYRPGLCEDMVHRGW